jgi:hypothetical protein
MDPFLNKKRTSIRKHQQIVKTSKEMNERDDILEHKAKKLNAQYKLIDSVLFDRYVDFRKVSRKFADGYGTITIKMSDDKICYVARVK